MSTTRRIFMRNGAMALVGTSALPAFLSRAVLGAETGPSSLGGNKRLVVIFQRGAADGLNIVVPHAETLTTRCARPSTSHARVSWTSMASLGCILP